VACAQRMGVSLAAHRSAPVSAELLAEADLILVMQGSHAAEIGRRWPRYIGQVRLLGAYLASAPYELPDPWGQEDAVFDRVFARIGEGVKRLGTLIQERG